jgi:hypothetical protein
MRSIEPKICLTEGRPGVDSSDATTWQWSISCFVLACLIGGLFQSTQADARPQPPPGPPPANLCQTPEHRQLDFWVGDWDVFRTDTNARVAKSHIEKLYAGCAVGEHWMPLQGSGGGSLNSYRPYSKQWVQVWTDSGNNLIEFAGSWDGKRMNFEGTSVTTSGQKQPVRMTYERGADGSVVQTGYQAEGRGKPWKVTYQLVYRRASAQQ